jgi:membrane associated rhomboid family serine protease
MTTLITAVHVVTMLAAAVLLTVGQGSWLALLAFKADFLFTGHVWSLVTYPFVHDITQEGIFFALEMLMFFWFGREVERVIGRTAFCWFYALLVLMPPMGLAALRLAAPGVIPDASLDGSSVIHFAVFIGFTLIYPNAQLLFGILAKWMAVVMLGIFSVVCIANHAWFSLAHLWLTVGSAWSMLRMAGVGGGFEWLNWYQSWQAERSERKAEASRQRHRNTQVKLEESVDAVLDKISREGMGSLTASERAVLELARQKLVKRDGSQR